MKKKKKKTTKKIISFRKTKLNSNLKKNLIFNKYFVVNKKVGNGHSRKGVFPNMQLLI